MTKTYYICKNCKKESKDIVGDKWIKINKLIAYSGRDKKEKDRIGFCIFDSRLDYHFCGRKCLMNYRS